MLTEHSQFEFPISSCKELILPSPTRKVWPTSAYNYSTGDIDQIPVFRYSFHPHGLWCPSKRIISYHGVSRLILCVCFTVFYAFFTSLVLLCYDKYIMLSWRETFFPNLLFSEFQWNKWIWNPLQAANPTHNSRIIAIFQHDKKSTLLAKMVHFIWSFILILPDLICIVFGFSVLQGSQCSWSGFNYFWDTSCLSDQSSRSLQRLTLTEFRRGCHTNLMICFSAGGHAEQPKMKI